MALTLTVLYGSRKSGDCYQAHHRVKAQQNETKQRHTLHASPIQLKPSHPCGL